MRAHFAVPVLASILIFGIFSTDQQAFATVFSCSSTLDGNQEVLPTTSPGTGTMIGTFDDTINLLSWNISWLNLFLPTTELSMHFHGPAPAGINAGIQVTIEANPGFISPSIGNTLITPLQESDLLAGLWYINLHTTVEPGGEIRGQVSCVPDEIIGGEIIPIDQTALLLAGVQSVSMWMIPVVISGIGIGVFVIKRRN